LFIPVSIWKAEHLLALQQDLRLAWGAARSGPLLTTLRQPVSNRSATSMSEEESFLGGLQQHSPQDRNRAENPKAHAMKYAASAALMAKYDAFPYKAEDLGYY
jgi:hypothetical protein